MTNINTMYSQNGMLSDTQITAFLDLLAGRASEVINLSARFEQVKRMDMIKGELVSHGKFLYSKENKVAFLYEKPAKYSMVMNGSYMKMVTASDFKNEPRGKSGDEADAGTYYGCLYRRAKRVGQL
ncbi:hypothetical protein MASR1M46_17930 [Bacteroidales bacterium]